MLHKLICPNKNQTLFPFGFYTFSRVATFPLTTETGRKRKQTRWIDLQSFRFVLLHFTASLPAQWHLAASKIRDPDVTVTRLMTVLLQQTSWVGFSGAECLSVPPHRSPCVRTNTLTVKLTWCQRGVASASWLHSCLAVIAQRTVEGSPCHGDMMRWWRVVMGDDYSFI